jgi:hypothetical protein
MTNIIIKILLGLFIWMVLPGLIYKKRKYKKNTLQYFAYIACKIVGIVILIHACIDAVRLLLNFH